VIILEVVYEIEKSNLQKAKGKVLTDDIVGRASILFKEGNALGAGNKYYCYISGIEEACKKSEELMKDLGKKVDEKTKEQIIKKIKEEEDKAMHGFGGIFG
jgi:cobyric acid synthase